MPELTQETIRFLFGCATVAVVTVSWIASRTVRYICFGDEIDRLNAEIGRLRGLLEEYQED